MTGRILVVCGSGASSTFLAHRLRSLAEADGLEIEAVAGSVADVRLDAAGMDVVLLGAHLADRIDLVRRAAADEGATAVLLDADASRPEGARAALDRALAAMRAGGRALGMGAAPGRPAGGAPHPA
ncbi:PTS sugar transporter subunit IIABC [Clavibacter tessellarius]|uniref:PTS sugar transporter subunit IIABC n=1 Tax=Clavibacter tessellarius TaxID=31965 RepID=A0A225CM81_9MICO|nr:PTS sugar transporter subunit IIABC [Clavibacter michiganensis]OQJ62852.1 PTS sugar transporter subunit IIABC [Clavibacter michiganensis subsp. tessellarius]UKF34161.1 PTS sugar transporter subunit IIABC [Clavibacter michiganensis subsp. tessellarius]